MHVDPQQTYAIEGRIEALLLGLGAVRQSDPRTLPAHVLAHGAALQLHVAIAGDPRAMQAGRALAGISTLLRNPGVAPGYLEPAMAVSPAHCSADLKCAEQVSVIDDPSSGIPRTPCRSGRQPKRRC